MNHQQDVHWFPQVEAYWEGAQEKRLLVPVCEECNATYFPPRVACPHCLASETTLRESAGTGTVYTYSIVRSDMHPVMGEQAPYPVALVDLDDGPTVFSTLVDCPLESVEVGMAVSVTFRELTDEQFLFPVFAPVE